MKLERSGLGVWTVVEMGESASRTIAVAAMRALGLNPNDFRARDTVTMGIDKTVNGMLDAVGGKAHEDGKRYAITWIDQNVVRVEDEQEDDEFYMNGSITVIRKYEAMEAEEGNAYFAGFIDGVDYCDGQLKSRPNNFREWG